MFVCVCVTRADFAIREGDSDDGLDLEAFSHQNEWREIPSLCQSSSKKLLRVHHVHSATAAEAMWRLQVRLLFL